MEYCPSLGRSRIGNLDIFELFRNTVLLAEHFFHVWSVKFSFLIPLVKILTKSYKKVQ